MNRGLINIENFDNRDAVVWHLFGDLAGCYMIKKPASEDLEKVPHNVIMYKQDGRKQRIKNSDICYI